jgi:hypothetical protein
MNMKRNQHQDFRQEMIEFLERDIVGPGSEAEVIEDAPTVRYSSGILFPQLVEDAGDDTTRAEGLDTRSRDEEEVGTIEQSTSFFPSAMGISFSVDKDIDDLVVEIDTAKYVPLEEADAGLVSLRVTSINVKYLQNVTFTDKFDYKDSYLTLKIFLLSTQTISNSRTHYIKCIDCKMDGNAFRLIKRLLLKQARVNQTIL